MTSLLRRLFPIAALLTLVLAACGDDSSDDGQTQAAAAPGAFPVTIEHALGSTTIKKAPERVVTVGYTDHETLLALGIKPVGAMDWFAGGTYGKWSWEQEAWGGKPAEVISTKAGEPNFEKIASLRPDLIIGLYAGLKQDQYDKLRQIAPTVAQAKGTPYTTPWKDMTRVAAKAVGQVDKGEQLIKNVDDKFAAFRESHPQAKGKQALVIDAGQAPKSYFPFATTDPRGQFLEALGYSPVPEVDKLAKGSFGTEIAAERVDLLDIDRLFLLIDPPVTDKLAKDRLFNDLKVAKDKRVTELAYYKGDQLGAALAFNTVLSIPFAIDGISNALGSAAS